MQIALDSIDQDHFFVKAGEFCGQAAVLVNPKITAKYDRANVIFRSSIYDMAGNLLSAGFKKFHNFEESPELFPAPKDLRGCNLLEKMDGSLCLTDYVNGQLSFRTRGTFSAETLENSADFNEIAARYPQILDYHKTNPGFTLLFEIVSPNQRIVIDYGPQVEIYLIGCVDKSDYSYIPQDELDGIAKTYGFKRPRVYSFDSIPDMVAAVTAFEGVEGVCIYYNGDQNIRKIKAARYLLLHRMKSELSSVEKVLDVFLANGCPSYTEFYEFISSSFDFELAESCKGSMSRICDAYKHARQIETGMEIFIKTQLAGLARKEQALKVISSYGDTNRAGFVFKKLDHKGLGPQEYKKMMLQLLG